MDSNRLSAEAAVEHSSILLENDKDSLSPSSKLRIVEWHFAGERMLAQFYMFSSLLGTDRRISLQINETDILFNSSSNDKRRISRE